MSNRLLDIGELFASATAAIEVAHSASIEGHCAPSPQALRAARVALIRALLDLQQVDIALRTTNPFGPTELVPRQELDLAITTLSSSALDFTR
tara:strand:- start:331 stop:609 length:279 start_codon:yes stop_codon:yes gene_type:complete